MTAKAMPALKKRKLDGTLYKRPESIENKLLEISSLARDEIATRCKIRDREKVGYIPSECLVHLVREHRTKSMDDCSEALFEALLERVIQSLPDREIAEEDSVGGFEVNVGDIVRDRFFDMLLSDRNQYLERLDMYEVRFAKALKMLRLDAVREVQREVGDNVPIEIDHQTGEISPEVERAVGLDPFDAHMLDDRFYLERLHRAMDRLSPLQKAILKLDQEGFPDESKDPDVLTISGLLKKTPKTIRTHRASALSALREVLTKGEPQ